MSKLSLLFYGATLLLFATGCGRSGIFEEYSTIPSTGWHKDSVVVFEFPVTDAHNISNMYLNIRNHVSYSYSNLWLFIEITGPSGEIKKDTFEIALADLAGKWLGHGFSGLKNQQVPYRNQISFPEQGNYRVSIRQGMREEVLKGISDIGIKIEKAN